MDEPVIDDGNPTAWHTWHAWHGLGPLIVTAALLGLIAFTGFARSGAPAARETDDAGAFSAKKAMARLVHLLGDETPHPVGSPANAAVRARLVEQLVELGLEPEVQTATVRTWGGKDVTVENVLARWAGREGGPAVMLVAHYDSVVDGPGASDDGVGVAAIIEIAAMLVNEAPLRHDVFFLFTDGEEAGLCGARAFVAEHPAAAEVKVVVNLEARGTSGPSLLFRTSADSAWLLEHFAATSPRPRSTSLFAEVFRYLPNDTDFSVFERHGMSGYDFAYIGDVANYHSPQDDLAHVSSASLQHHGDQTLGLVRALGEVDLKDTPTGRVVHFDLLGVVLIRLPARLMLPGAAVALGLLAVMYLRLRRRHLVNGTPTSIARLSVAVAGALLLATATTTLLRTAGALRGGWPEPAWPVYLAVWSAVLLAIVTVTTFGAPAAFDAQRAAGRRIAMWIMVWTGFAVVGIGAALVVPGASYLFVLPALAAGIFGFAAARFRAPMLFPVIGVVGSAAVAGLLWLPLDPLFHDGLGISSGLIVGARATVVLIVFAPTFVDLGPASRRAVTAIAGAGLLAGAAATFIV